METLRQFFITLGLDWDSAGFAQALTAEKLLEKASAALFTAFQELERAVVGSVEEFTAYGSVVNDAAAASGSATDALQEWRYVFEQNGVAGEAFTSTVTRLSHRMGEAASGSKEASAAFAALHVRVKGTDGQLRSSDEVFAEIVNKLGAIKNPTDRANKAFEVFGRGAREILPVLAQGGEEIERLRQRFRDLGITMSKEQVEAADRFGDSLDTLAALMASIRRDFAAPLVEALQPLIDNFLDWAAANREVIRTNVANAAKNLIGIVRTLAATLTTVANAGKAVLENWRLIAFSIGAWLISRFVLLNAELGVQAALWLANIRSMAVYAAASIRAAVQSAAAWVAAAAPVLLLSAGLLLAALAAEDLYYFLTDGDSVLGTFGPKWTKLIDEWVKFKPEDSGFVKAVKLVVGWLTDIQGRLLPTLQNSFETILYFVNEQLKAMGTNLERIRATAEAILRLSPQVQGATFLGRNATSASDNQHLTPTPRITRSGNNTRVVTQSFAPVINVDAGGVSSPEKLAPVISSTLETWWDGKVREAAAAPGE